MRKKGFTLLELLAVIVVLAIIALIVTPFVTNAIKQARLGAFKNSAYGIINAAELYYGEKLVHQDYSTTVIEIEKGSINPNTFKYKGGKIEKGYIEINELGKTKMYLWNNGYCALKTYNEAEIQITTTKKEECRFKTPRKLNLTSNVDGWTGLDITITMETDEELVKYQYNISKDATSYDNTKWVDTAENKILINEENITEDGEYYIYARGVNEDGEGEATSIKIQIDRSPQELTIINSTGGTITKDKETYKIGEKVLLTVTTSTGYELKTLTYNDGEAHDITNKKEFIMPKGPVTVSATWEKIPYTITVINTSGGNLTVNKTTAYYGDVITVTASATTNYALSTLTYNGINITSAKSFTMPASNVTVSAIWIKMYYKTGTNDKVDVIYYNPVTNTKCMETDYNNNTNKLGNTGCLKWYTIENSGSNKSTVDVILDHNTSNGIKWNSSDTNTTMKEVATKLAEDTSTWHESVKGTARLIKANEVARITGADTALGFDSATSTNSKWFYLDGADGTDTKWQTQVAKSKGASKYAWLFDNTSSCTSYGCNVADTTNSSNYGYWTQDAVSGHIVYVWFVRNGGNLDRASAYSSYYGVRPVITISKNVLK